ncbi:unnamed protein product, partial [Rotaria sp. Silwood1]
MPKSKAKLKKSMITTSTETVVELSEALESTKCNCTSSRNDSSTEKLQVFSQSNSQSSSSSSSHPSRKLKSRKYSRKLCYSNILSELFIMNNNKLNEQKG